MPASEERERAVSPVIVEERVPLAVLFFSAIRKRRISIPFSLTNLLCSSLTRTCCLEEFIHHLAYPRPKLPLMCSSAMTPPAPPGVLTPSSFHRRRTSVLANVFSKANAPL